MTDDQLALLWQHTNDSIWMIGQWMNSAALWRLFGMFLGLVICASIISMIISKIFTAFHFPNH